MYIYSIIFMANKYVMTCRYVNIVCLYIKWRGTEMIASSSTFRQHLGRVISDQICSVSCMLYGMVRKH